MGNLAPLMAVCHQLCMGLARNCHFEDFEDSSRRHHPTGSMSHTVWCGYNKVVSSLLGTFLDNISWISLYLESVPGMCWRFWV